MCPENGSPNYLQVLWDGQIVLIKMVYTEETVFMTPAVPNPNLRNEDYINAPTEGGGVGGKGRGSGIVIVDIINH